MPKMIRSQEERHRACTRTVPTVHLSWHAIGTCARVTSEKNSSRGTRINYTNLPIPSAQYNGTVGTVASRMRSGVRYLEVEDDGPDEAEDYGRLPVHNIAGVDVHKLNLAQNSTRS
jgi:hypothetical protein